MRVSCLLIWKYACFFKLSQQGYATPVIEVNNTRIYNGRLSRICCIFTCLLSHVSGSNKLYLPIVSRKNIFLHHPFENMFLLRRLDDNLLTSKNIYCMCILYKCLQFYENKPGRVQAYTVLTIEPVYS